MEIKAEVIADSVNENGTPITTFRLEYPRFIHAELMTHRVFSRNSMSSRAVPVSTMIELVRNNPAHPLHWGKKQKGMQAEHENHDPVHINLNHILDGLEFDVSREEAWEEAKEFACAVAEGFDQAGYHKQCVNRLIEPFQMMRVLVTATEFDNWYALRNHKDAMPEIHVLAEKMLQAHNESIPRQLTANEWHTPFYGDGVWSPNETGQFDNHGVKLDDALKISCSCCAQVSFRKEDRSIEKAHKIWDTLVGSEPVHASAIEHCAKPIEQDLKDIFWEEGITHMDRIGRFWSGNFRDWIQYRQLISNHVCNDYELLEREK